MYNRKKYDPQKLFEKFTPICQSILVLPDTGTGCAAKINLQNHTVIPIKVDGENGLIEIEGQRCDWCIKDCDEPYKYLFIELKTKGFDAAKNAMKQIGCTITWFLHNIEGFSLQEINGNCYAIMKKGCPGYRQTFQNDILKFKIKFGCKFNIKNKNCTIPLYSEE